MENILLQAKRFCVGQSAPCSRPKVRGFISSKKAGQIYGRWRQVHSVANNAHVSKRGPTCGDRMVDFVTPKCLCLQGQMVEPHSSYPQYETKDKVWAKADWPGLLLLHAAMQRSMITVSLVQVQSRYACDIVLSCYQCNYAQILYVFMKKSRENINYRSPNSLLLMCTMLHRMTPI